MFEPQRRADNKQWKQKDKKCPCQESTFYMTMPPLISVRLFPRLKKMLSGNKYMSRSSLGSTSYQCLQQIPKEDCLFAFRDWVKRLQKSVSVKGEYFEGF